MLLAAVLFAYAVSNDPGLPSRAPVEVGMSADRLAHIDRLIAKGIDAGGFPGAAVIVGRAGYSVFQKGYGSLSWNAGAATVSPVQTIYDLASLTKVVGTTTAIMILYDEGKLDLEAPVSRYLPAFKGGDKEQVTVAHLLTHTSGLPAGRQLWLQARTPAKARELVIATPLRCKPGTCLEYSDLGPDLLGFIVEVISKKKLDAFLTERVFAPLGMHDTFFKPATAVKARVAPTEVNPPRGYRLQGEVHDESAFTLGGVSGHAGLFSTASDLSVFAQMLLNRGEYNGTRIVAESTVVRFTTRRAHTRALGWDTANGEAGAGQFLSERAFGHSGYTGTSLWIDPDRNMFVILLTNRVHAPKARQPGYLIADVRNDLGDAAALAVVEGPFAATDFAVTFRSDTASYWNARVVRRR